MLRNAQLGSRSNPYEDMVLIDAIIRSQKLRRPLYVKVEDNSGFYKVFPDGNAVLIREGHKRIKRKEVKFSAETRERRIK